MKVEPAVSLEGHFAVPGDKSISHRALLLGAISEGTTVIRGFGRSGDTESTLAAVRALGVQVDEAGDELHVHGVGLRGLQSAEIDCGNAGTLARLLVGLLVFQEGTFTLTGDESLSARPMERVAGPLRLMGAQIEATDGHLPLTVTGAPLHAIDYELPVASAQVKSAILLAGLGAVGRTTVIEPVPTRDHTELMLRAAGASVSIRPSSVSVDGAERISVGAVDVPGDFSSAAPFIAAASLVPESRLTIHDVSLNPRRTGLLDRARSDGRPRRHPLPQPTRPRAGRRPRDPHGRADRDDDPHRGGAAAGRRAAALRPARGRLARARAGSTARPSCA